MKSFPGRFILLAGCGVALSTSPGADPGAGSFHGTAGLQLYSLREQFKQDVPGTLDRVKALGFTLVETAGTYGNTPEKFAQMLKERGLTPVSAHYQYEALTKDIAAVVREAQALGVQFVVCPWIPHQGDVFTEADARRAAADFNRWGEALQAAKIRFGYHCHGYEFRPLREGAKETAFDVLVRETKPSLVTFEMDVFWVMHPGQDPAALLAKYPTRWGLMHLKDIRKGAATGSFTGHAPLTDDVTLGTGQVDWPRVLKEAARVDVKYYFIEDESPTVLEQIPHSLKYLESLKAK
jgi:sugar phosphate isomerase/epimerase